MSYHLIDLVQRLGTPKVLVLGDLILDRYIWGDAERISQEAPVILLREQHQEIRLGGAANVANMLRGLDANVAMAGIVGTDADGDEVRSELRSAGVDCRAVISDPNRPTTVKERFIGKAHSRHPHQILRVDREVRHAVEGAIAAKLLAEVMNAIETCDAILISDYAKGVCTPEILQAVIQAGRRAGIPVIADPAASGDYIVYKGATAVTPNRLETSRATGRQIVTQEDAFAAGHDLCRRLELDHAYVTLDSDGIALVSADGNEQMLPTRKREVYDITGAGDMVLAMIGVGAAAGIEPLDLAKLANVAGGLEVERIGVVRVTRDEMLADLLANGRSDGDKLCEIDVLARHVQARKSLGHKVVLTNGCFDVLHIGHVTYLQQAAREGQCLIVAVNSDDSVRQLGKGSDRPIFGQVERARMLSALEAVDYVLIFNEATPHALLERLKPDVLVKGGTYNTDEIVGREIVRAYGGEVKALGEVPGVSTTRILQKLRGEAGVIPHPHTLPQRKAG